MNECKPLHNTKVKGTYARSTDEIGVPCTVRHLHVLDAPLPLSRLTKDMSKRDLVISMVESIGDLPVF
jgi:hypothetical protein